MATQVDYARIVLLNRTKRELQAADPVLLSGETSIADVGTIRPEIRVGDGIRPWSALPSFLATGVGGGIFAPFEVQNTINGHPLFQVKDLPGLAPGDSIITMGPGEAGIAGTNLLTLNGNVNGYVLQVNGALHTQPNIYLASFAAPINPGRSNGVWIAAGTNANDACFVLENAASAYGTSNKQQFMIVRGDGSGALGPEPNQLIWNAAGHFTVTGDARFPGDAISELRDVQLINLRLGDVLEWNGTYWANVPPQRGTVTEIRTGTGLLGGPIFESGTIWLADTTVQAGNYTVPNLTIDQQGRITAAANGGLNDLHDLEITDPTDGQVLEFENGKWVNMDHVVDLAGLSDVALGNLTAGQILTWNGDHWVNGDPAHNLGELTNVLLTDPRPGEQLTFDGWNWVNSKGASVTVDALAPIDPETGYLWWDIVTGQLFIWYTDGENGRWVIANNWQGGGGGASVTVNTSPPADPESGWLWWDSVGGQLYVWYDDGESAQWVIANSGDGGGGAEPGPGGGGGLAQNQWGTYVIEQSELAKENWSNTLQVIGGDYAWALEVFESGAAGSPNFGNGLCIYTTNSGPQPALRVWDGTVNGLAFQIGNNGSGEIKAYGGVNRMYWDATGFYLPTGVGMPTAFDRLATISDVKLTNVTLTNPTVGQALTYDGTVWKNANTFRAPFYVDNNSATTVFVVAADGTTTVSGNGAKMVGLSVPIAFSLKKAGTSVNAVVTMPLTLPANFVGSRAWCNSWTNYNSTHPLWKRAGADGPWTQIGSVSFVVNSSSGSFSGAGATLAAGDVLQVDLQADDTLGDVAITLHATRA